MSGSLTRVALLFIPQRFIVYLRFGRPAHERIIDDRRRVAEFGPEAVFCRIRWQGNEYGTTLWQLWILQAAARGERFQRVAGVVPGATLLLHVRGARKVQPVFDSCYFGPLDASFVRGRAIPFAASDGQ
jgi:hypothetical protein